MSSQNVESCPYNSLPDSAYWKKSMLGNMTEMDPVVGENFKLSLTTKISTAGSCFAQHIARYLSKSGYNYFVPEKAPSKFEESISKKYGYGLFSARFGNIYTVKQLVQLTERAYDLFSPSEEFWTNPDGTFLDPYRPSVVPGGFLSLKELQADRKSHLSAFRSLIEDSNVFIFTLGLTESWRSKSDGAVFPICPGCGGGTFDENKYEFHNYTVSETISDLNYFLELVKRFNPSLKVIFTVSPVPLVATMDEQHVLCSTVYSKSVLRAAVQEVVNANSNTVYFPSYEIISGSFNRGKYFSDNLRGVKEEGVAHVMKIFFRHFSENSTEPNNPEPINEASKQHDIDLVDVICDEELLVSGVKI